MPKLSHEREGGTSEAVLLCPRLERKYHVSFPYVDQQVHFVVSQTTLKTCFRATAINRCYSTTRSHVASRTPAFPQRGPSSFFALAICWDCTRKTYTYIHETPKAPPILTISNADHLPFPNLSASCCSLPDSSRTFPSHTSRNYPHQTSPALLCSDSRSAI